MSTPHDAESAKNRIWLPLALPLGAAAITAVLIVAIGSMLLAFDSTLMDIGDEHVGTPVLIALVMTIAVLVGATIAAKMWADDA